MQLVRYVLINRITVIFRHLKQFGYIEPAGFKARSTKSPPVKSPPNRSPPGGVKSPLWSGLKPTMGNQKAAKWWCEIISFQFKQAVGGRPPQYAPVPCDLDLWPFDLESGVRVTCDVGYLLPIFVFLGLSVLDLGPMYATDRRQTASPLNAPA